MDAACEQWERRSATRYPTPGKLWCLGEQDENFATGWTTDTSKSGLAFVTRAGDRVSAGDKIDVAHTDPRNGPPECETLQVCRVEPYGPSIYLIACSRFG